MDERLNTECGNLSNVDADDPEHLLPSVVPEFKKVSKVAHLRKLHIALQCCIIEERAAAECSKLTYLSNMFKLPREVRDNVYHELVVSNGTFVLEGQRTGVEPIRVPYDWFMNPKFVGHAMALELAEIYYAHNGFQIWNPELFPGVFPIIPPKDPLGTKFESFKLIRHLVLIWDVDCGRPKSFKNMYHILDQLTLISRKDLLSFGLTLRGFDSAFWSAPQTLNALEMLRKPVYDLKHADSTIRVDQILEIPRNIEKRELINWSRASASAHFGSTGFFQLSPDDWEKEKSATDLWDPTVHFVDDSIDATQIHSLLKKRWGIIDPMQGIHDLADNRTCWFGWGASQEIDIWEEGWECDPYS